MTLTPEVTVWHAPTVGNRLLSVMECWVFTQRDGDLTADNDKHHRRINQSDDCSVNYHQLILIVSDGVSSTFQPLTEAGRLMFSGTVSTFVF